MRPKWIFDIREKSIYNIMSKAIHLHGHDLDCSNNDWGAKQTT